MSTSHVDELSPRARAVAASVEGETLVVVLEDGRTLSVPLSWFPRLAGATEAERRHLRLIGSGVGIHWPDLDEDISVAGLLRGR